MIKLIEDFETEGTIIEYMKCTMRSDSSLTPMYFIAYILDPLYCGNKLKKNQYEITMEYMNE